MKNIFYLCCVIFDFLKKRLVFAPSWRWTCRIACKKMLMAPVAGFPLSDFNKKAFGFCIIMAVDVSNRL